MFVTNTRFSSEAETYAKHNQITLYDGEKLKNEFYLMSIGSLDSSSLAGMMVMTHLVAGANSKYWVKWTITRVL